jgi:hypothetical protein
MAGMAENPYESPRVALGVSGRTTEKGKIRLMTVGVFAMLGLLIVVCGVLTWIAMSFLSPIG